LVALDNLRVLIETKWQLAIDGGPNSLINYRQTVIIYIAMEAQE